MCVLVLNASILDFVAQLKSLVDCAVLYTLTDTGITAIDTINYTTLQRSSVQDASDVSITNHLPDDVVAILDSAPQDQPPQPDTNNPEPLHMTS